MLKGARIKKIALLCLPFIASALMLTVIQPPFELASLAWISLVPFILACSPESKPVHLAVAAYLVSLCYWLGNIYWIGHVTIIGWIAFCLYTAFIWPIAALSLRYLRTKKIPLLLIVPVIFVTAEQMQGLFLGGFNWRFLAHSQYRNITIIQIVDIFGATGVSFLIAMVNGVIAELILAARQKSILKIHNFLKIAIAAAAVIGTIFYGQWRIAEAEKIVEPGPLVASIQSNIPESVKLSFKAKDSILNEMLQNSEQSLQVKPQLIVWPETMVQTLLDPRVLNGLDSSYECRIYDGVLREHSKNNAFLLVGAYGGVLAGHKKDLVERYNSAFLYRPDGTQASQRYDKIHLVIFGELIPFKKSIPWLHNLLIKFTPYDFDYSLDAGESYTVFEMTGDKDGKGQSYKFSVMICYEDAVPGIARKFVLDEHGQKKIDWLVNISNDGWFVRFKNDKVLPSTELAQHTSVCVFRAVENRLAVLRSVNTGISCLIDSSGRIRDSYVAAGGDFPAVAMKRQGIAGWFVDKMPIDKRITLFSKYGRWLDFFCIICFMSLLSLPLWKRFSNRGKKDE